MRVQSVNIRVRVHNLRFKKNYFFIQKLNILLKSNKQLSFGSLWIRFFLFLSLNIFF